MQVCREGKKTTIGKLSLNSPLGVGFSKEMIAVWTRC